MRIKPNIFIILLIIMPLNNVLAADLCAAKVLREVAAVENPDSILQRGDELSAITMYSENKQTGVGVFCSHGGYCYPRYVSVNGKKLEALRLTNCNIGKADTEYANPDEILYRVDVDRSKVPASVLREDDLENQFLEMGLCNACADNVAEIYIKKPSSRCAKLAKRALEGNPEAIEKLVSFPDDCMVQ